MKRRGLRVTLTAGAIGLVVVAVVVVFNWVVVRDHVEAWWFVGTRETVEISPRNVGPRQWAPCSWLLQPLADAGNRPVIFDRAAASHQRGTIHWEDVLQRLRGSRFRILEQRFPRRPYVVVGYPPMPSSAVPWVGE